MIDTSPNLKKKDRTFCKQTVDTLIRRHILWRLACVCTCPIKRTPGFNEQLPHVYWLILQVHMEWHRNCCGGDGGNSMDMHYGRHCHSDFT